MARFEELLNAQQERHLRVDELCMASGVSARLLRLRCREALGMSPISYIQLRALHAVHEILRHRGLEAVKVSHVARCHGFRQLGRFAATYRSLFGELPSTTARRGSKHLVTGLAPHK
jgi:AraC-like DNA-binding protein